MSHAGILCTCLEVHALHVIMLFQPLVLELEDLKCLWALRARQIIVLAKGSTLMRYLALCEIDGRVVQGISDQFGSLLEIAEYLGAFAFLRRM